MLSFVLGVVCAAFSMSAFVSQIYADKVIEAEAMPSWICAIALAATASLALYLPTRKAPAKMHKKEAMCIVGLGWIIVSVFGAVPYILILDCSYADAFFESASGITTTGATVFGNVEAMPQSLLFWRALSQWIGGLGVVVFFVAIVSFLGSGAKTLYIGSGESGTHAGDVSDYERIQSLTLRTLFLYLAISTVCVLTFKIMGMDWFDGICHMFTTVSTGGFSVYNDSIAHYNNPAIYWCVIFFMVLGGISFATILMTLKGKFACITRNTELWAYFGILAVSTFTIAIILLKDKDLFAISTWSSAITHSAFQVVAVMTSTGFSISNYQQWLPITHIILFVLMIIGACAGSTSGGLKVLRFVVVTKFIKEHIEKSFRPRVVRPLRLNGKILDASDVENLISHVCLYAIVCLGGFCVLATLEPSLDFTSCISAVISSASNIGPALGEFSPDKNFGFLSSPAKILLGIVMIMGRLEFYSIIVLFMPSLWKKFQ